jgi:outer membrane protein
MNVCSAVITCLMCVFLTLGAYAQEHQITLDECISIAMENHPEIRISQEDTSRAEALYGVSKAPNTVIVNGVVNTVEILKQNKSTSGFNVPGKDTSIGLFAGASAVYNIYDATKQPKQSAAKQNITLSHVNQIKVRSKVQLNVKVAYYGYLFATQAVSLKDNLRAKYRTKLEKTRMLFQNGQRPILDVTKAEVDLANANLDYERAVNQQSFAHMELLTSMGLGEASFSVAPVPIEALPEVKYSMEQLFDVAEDEYPDFRIARISRSIQKTNLETEKAGRKPTVDVVGSFGMENRNLSGMGTIAEDIGPNNWKPTVHFALQAKVPIYTGGALSGKIDAAKAEYRKSMYTERQVITINRALIQNYVQSMGELRKQMDLAKLMKVNAENHLKLAMKSYENGVGSQLDLQDAETSLINADLYSYKARYDYLIALARLANSVGVGEEQLCK